MAQEKKLAAGQVFGQWTLVGDEALGKGGNGVVWEATNQSGMHAAIKFLHKNHFMPPGKRFARFRDEVTFLQQEGKRDGVLPLIDASIPDSPSAEDRPWLTTPLAVPFMKLDLKGGAKLPDLIRRVERVANTLAALHKEGKHHRDIKPDNLLELDGVPVVADFGLVDFPGKEAVTEAAEMMGTLFYLAPEMMEAAADRPAGPADVYSLAKTLWVLATGQTYPLLGEMRADSPQLRLSTYCRHPRAHVLDLLLERATRHNPRDRPTMEGFGEELSAWLTVPDKSPISIDLSDLAREYQSVFEVRNRDERHRQEFETEVSGILAQLGAALDRVAVQTESVTRIPANIGEAYDLPVGLHFPQSQSLPRVLHRQARQAETVTGDMHRLRLQSFVQVEALENETVRVVVGHLVRYEVGASRDPVPGCHRWIMEATEARGSAALENKKTMLFRGLVENTKVALQWFAEQVKAVPP